MKIIQHRLQDFGYLCVENLYTNRELCSIKNEIKNINYIFDSVPDIQDIRDIDSGKTENSAIKGLIGCNLLTGCVVDIQFFH